MPTDGPLTQDPAGNRSPALLAFLPGVVRWPLTILFWLLGILVTGWCALALWYAPTDSAPLRAALAGALVLLVAALAILPRRRRVRLAGPPIAWAAVILWFWFAPAPADWAWQPDVRVTPAMTVAGDVLTVTGVRNFDWRSDTDFTERWETRTYDLRALRTVDLFASYWGPKDICHNFVSFGFERTPSVPGEPPMDYLCLSIETRKAVGQEYSAVGGMFRQYPLVIVAADERDLVGVRARVRGEHVFRYQVQSPPAGVRAVFDRYMQFTNDLALHPRWYNAVTESCGVGILRIVRGSLIPFIPSMDQLLNGRWDRDAYREGRLGAPGESFEQVRARSEITEEARKAPMTPWFSPAIRVQEVPLRLRRPLEE